jgi:hypothetical protein
MSREEDLIVLLYIPDEQERELWKVYFRDKGCTVKAPDSLLHLSGERERRVDIALLDAPKIEDYANLILKEIIAQRKIVISDSREVIAMANGEGIEAYLKPVNREKIMGNPDENNQ